MPVQCTYFWIVRLAFDINNAIDPPTSAVDLMPEKSQALLGSLFGVAETLVAHEIEQ